MGFTSFGLSPAITQVVNELAYTTATEVQRLAIPAILAGRDLLATANTGTGKTAAFALPLLHNLAQGDPARGNQVRALILVPTRELALQVADDIKTYGRLLPLRTLAVYGGVKINPQMMALRKGADVLVATPGRLLDLYSQNALRFPRLETLVLDEADRMLDLGFADEIDTLVALLPTRRQNLLFSATLSDDIRNLARTLVRNPVEISVTPHQATAAKVKHWLCPVDKKRKPALLAALIRDRRWSRVLVFVKTRQGADRLANFLKAAGIDAAALHGDMSQGARSGALAAFNDHRVQALVATDVAARGLDIEQLPLVVNVDLPIVPQDYIHRIGRSGRAGAAGEAISLVSADEFRQLTAIEQLIKKVIPREAIDGFEPSHEVPESRQISDPVKPKRAKKAKLRQPPERPAKRPAARPPRGNTSAAGRAGRGGASGGGKATAKARSGGRPSGRRTAKP